MRPDRQCERCGCTDSHACPGGCAWDPELEAAGRDVCTSCTYKKSGKRSRPAGGRAPLKRKAS